MYAFSQSRPRHARRLRDSAIISKNVTDHEIDSAIDDHRLTGGTCSRVCTDRVHLCPQHFLEKVFKEIRKQTGYTFLYTDEQLFHARAFSLELKNVPLKEALDQCFENQPLHYTIENKTIVVKRKPAPVKRRRRCRRCDSKGKGNGR